MADNENARKPHVPHYGRRNPPGRAPAGVQKAMHNFGVKDLREFLDKKHQEQGDSQDDKNSQPKKKLPPPDPSYNYLSDPSRDKPKSPPPKKEEHRKPQDKQHGNKNFQQRFRNERSRNQEQENNNSSPNNEEGAVKKELRFSDNAKDDEAQFTRGGRSSFRGRNSRRGQGERPRENREEKIENPVNIKIQLSTETGQRSCILDENTKIADIKHVPDQIFTTNRSLRGGFRGARSGFRGRARGRGNFRGRAGSFNRRGRPGNASGNSESLGNSDLKDEPAVEQLNEQANTSETNSENQLDVHNLEDYDEGDQEANENEEFVDSNENYDEDDDNNTEPVQNVVDESEKFKEIETNNSFNANLAETITVTSSKYQDGEVKRSIEVKSTNDEDKTKNDILENPPANKDCGE